MTTLSWLYKYSACNIFLQTVNWEGHRLCSELLPGKGPRPRKGRAVWPMQTRRNCVVGKGFETGSCARCLYCFAAHGASAVFVAVLSDLCGGLPATVGAEGNFALFAFRLLDLTPRASQLIKPKRETESERERRERENPAGARARARMMQGPAPLQHAWEGERARESERERERERNLQVRVRVQG